MSESTSPEPGGEQPVSDPWKTAGEAAARMPPADFSTVVQMLSTQAMVALGALPHPSTGKAQPQLPLAQHFIDLLGVIEAKTMGNLEPDETELMTQTLHYLRMTFVEIRRKRTAQ